jgi:hypothetical protein
MLTLKTNLMNLQNNQLLKHMKILTTSITKQQKNLQLINESKQNNETYFHYNHTKLHHNSNEMSNTINKYLYK